ncbi:MAG TPA: serine hydrolase [Gemmatimonadaceae bacterium]|jgi:Beta-lactamase class C and other penicillin binding proteins
MHLASRSALTGAMLALSAAVLPTPSAAQKAPAPPADLDSYVTRVMKEFQVPGLSVAIVKDGKVVVAKGYGVRELGKPGKVDAHTRFGIASNTKIFTATALALLVEDGKLEWDAPVIRYLPAFAMYDPYVTREITVRDLLVHRSGLGLGAGDLMWWPSSDYSRDEIVQRLRYIKPATSFRSAYAYDNVLYSVAGEVIQAVSGQSWEDFVSSRILSKIGMRGSNVYASRATKGDNDAIPHAEIEGTVRPITPFANDNVDPAGGINSSAADMARWLIVQLDSGRVADGSRLFSPRSTRQLWAMVTPIPIGDPAPELAALRPQFNGYALGLGVRDYRGRKILTHTGGLPGYVSQVTMIPSLRLGVVVLTNQESGSAFQSITYHVLDHYLGVPPTDYVSIYSKLDARQAARFDSVTSAASTARDSASGPSLPLERYAGKYTDPWYGEIDIERDDDGLVIRFAHTPALVGDLVHWQHDTFVARWRDRELRADAYVTFALNPDGTIAHATMQAVSPATDFSYDFQDLFLTRVR